MITKTSCQQCGQHLEFETDSAGEFVTCPSCGKLTRLFSSAKPASPKSRHFDDDSMIANALKVFAVLNLFGAGFGGISVGQGDLGLGLTIFAGGVLGGLVLFGLASIIERLKRIEVILKEAVSK